MTDNYYRIIKEIIDENLKVIIAKLHTLLRHPGKVMISGYDNEMYNEMLNGWNRVQQDTLAECGLRRTEVLWMNYEPSGQMSIFDMPEVKS